MNGFDLIIILIFIISIVIGIMRGLIKEALSIIGWIAAIWLAVTFNTAAGDWFSQYISIPNATFRGWIGFTLVFILTMFVFAVINFAITKMLVRGPIKATDRVLGIAFGAARAGLVVVALLIILRGVGMAESDFWQESKLSGFFLPAADVIEPLVFERLPESVTDESSVQRKILDQSVKDLGQPDASVD